MTTESLDYLIRFQNTGNDTAFVVEIEDQLSEHLDWSSLDIKSSSHDMTTHVSELGVIQFLFADIYLPDSIVDELNSHGYVKYSINLKEDLEEGTVIENTADIYFDFNAAVITNTTTNTLALWASLNDLPSNENLVTFFPNPTHSILTISYPELDDASSYHISIFNLLGEMVYRSVDIYQETYSFNMEGFDQGVYLISVQNARGEDITTGRIIKQ
ncbi:MAG: T9SS type A sorting domain-containing protein [Crocinitomix sp.]|nr:T9SS type A sorting domain-containing protein [Crocinitomix sp.]